MQSEAGESQGMRGFHSQRQAGLRGKGTRGKSQGTGGFHGEPQTGARRKGTRKKVSVGRRISQPSRSEDCPKGDPARRLLSRFFENPAETRVEVA
jgi:hypothetical protein